MVLWMNIRTHVDDSTRRFLQGHVRPEEGALGSNDIPYSVVVGKSKLRVYKQSTWTVCLESRISSHTVLIFEFNLVSTKLSRRTVDGQSE